MAFVLVTDVEARVGRSLTATERTQVGAWIEDLSALVLARVPDLDERISPGEISAAVVKSVFCNAIIRVLRNPEGLRQHTESIDDYSVTKTIDSSGSAGLLFLTDDEWALILPGVSGDAFTIRSYGAPDRVSGWWVHPDRWVPYP